jgi:AraC family transcriptional regulator, L-rhamnose operon transcriptional activator RhaR
MALPQKILEPDARDPNSVLHRLTSAYIPNDGVVGIFRANHYPTTPWHVHDFFELAIVESGTAYHVSDRRIDPVEAGTVLFLPPGVGHEYRLCTGVSVYNCLFRAELAEAELMWAFRDEHLGALFDPVHRSRREQEDGIVQVQLGPAAMTAAIDALEPIRTGAPEARTRAGQLGHLLIALDIVATALHLDVRQPEAVQSLPASVVAALGLLERDIAHPWTLAELSHQTFVGPTHLARMFTRHLGAPPIHYLSRLRAERAAMMLVRTEDSVASVGAAVGWPDPAYFSRRFRAQFGVSPREYRHRHQRMGATESPVAECAVEA